MDPIYTYRRPKPDTPPPKEPSPPKVAAAAGGVEGAPVSAEGGAVAVQATTDGEAPASTVAAAPKEPSPFELKKDLPPDGAEVPFVKSYEAPGAAPAAVRAPSPSPAPEEKAPTPAPEPEPVAAVAEEAAPASELAPAPEEAPAEA